MNSITLINSSLTSPEKQYPTSDVTLINDKKKYPKENTNLRIKIKETINPNNRPSNIIFTLPFEWKESMYLYLTQGSPDYELSKFLGVVSKFHNYLFPDQKNRNLILIPIMNPENCDIDKGIALWFDMFSLSRSVFKVQNRLEYLKNKILKNTTRNVCNSNLVQVICMEEKMTKRSARLIHRKLVKQRQALKPPSQLQFTIHLQDNKNPFVLLWVDSDNVCSFNLSKLTEFQALADFANTLLCFISFFDPCKE